jgi:nucleoside-diphosphate-sugar epimerase
VSKYIAFLDGVTGYLGRWTLFWFLEELSDEKVAVLIRPQAMGEKAQVDVDRRLDEILAAIGMSSERDRVTAIPGDLSLPMLGNPDAFADLQASCWIHVAGDVTFKKLGDTRSLTTNLDYTINFVETAAQAKFVPRTVCHTSTFYVFEKANTPDAEFTVPEEFHDVSQMEHHNAYGYSKLKAEAYLQSLVESKELPFNLLVFRPDIIMHHLPVPEVTARKPGLVTDDFKVVYQLLAACAGQLKIKVPNGPTIQKPLKYLPVNSNTVLNISDVDSATKAMMQLAALHADGGLVPENGYQIFQMANRWQPIPVNFIQDLADKYIPDITGQIQIVSIEDYKENIFPNLPWVEKFYYGNFIDPFLGYMHRARTNPITTNVDQLLGEAWHNFHPSHRVNQADWLHRGVTQAYEKNFGQD